MDVPDGWTRHTVGSLGRVVTGSTPATQEPEYWNGHIPFITPSDLGVSRHARNTQRFVTEAGLRTVREIPAGSVLVTCIASLGKNAVSTMRCCTNQQINAVIPEPENDAYYLYYSLTYQTPRLILHAGTTAVPIVSKKMFAALPILLPPLGEQRKIAAILSSVDEAIEKTQAVIDQVQVVKKGLMQELLTRGLPGRHTRFKQTEIGEIPASWEVARLGDIACVSSGGTPSRTDASFWNGNIPWVKTGQVKYEAIHATDEKITQAGLEQSAAKLLPPGTILMAMYGQGLTRGRVGWLGVAAATNQACAAIEPIDGMLGDYIYQVLASRYDEIRAVGNEGSQKNLNLSLVKAILLPVPTPAEQEAIAAVLKQCDERADYEQKLSVELKHLKQSLMSVLLTGELRVTP